MDGSRNVARSNLVPRARFKTQLRPVPTAAPNTCARRAIVRVIDAKGPLPGSEREHPEVGDVIGVDHPALSDHIPITHRAGIDDHAKTAKMHGCKRCVRVAGFRRRGCLLKGAPATRATR